MTTMDIHAAKAIGAGLAMTGLIGAGLGLGILFGNYLQAAIRNPAAAAGERTYLFIGMALAESMGLFAFVLGLLIYFV
jgi:F-type H+-transporting ATPase subunit c